ncbi:GlxA family transcriptional regulator [Streptomyces sp. NPDC004065]|uniref:GlxA family transcriptional regulator n=1 Tax=Streptomyces sp. NPDC004065 TaxID=3364689 RepID=UPI00384E8615
MDRPGEGCRTHLVVMALFDCVQLLDVTGPLEVFAAANDRGACYRLLTASPGGGLIRTTAGARLAPDAALEDITGRVDTLIVPGRADWRAAVSDAALIDGIGRLAGLSRRVAAVCAGAFPLAATGLLDGHRAATHWMLAPELARTFPRVQVDSDSIFVRDGRIISSAGVTSGIDLALSLVEEDYGPKVARAAAKYLVVFLARPGGQSQFSVRQAARQPRHQLVRQVLDDVTANPAADHSLEAVARRAGVSVRQLTRLFRAEAGVTVTRFVEQIRVEAAQGLLESGTDALDVIARRSGFGSEETLRRAFQRELGITPGSYRARFRTTGTNGLTRAAATAVPTLAADAPL